MHEIEGLLNSPGFWFSVFVSAIVSHLIALAINSVFKVKVGWFNAIMIGYCILSLAVATYLVFFSGYHERAPATVMASPKIMLMMLYGIFPASIAALLMHSDEGDWLGPVTLKITFVVLVCSGLGLTIYALVKSPVYEWGFVAVLYCIVVSPVITMGLIVATVFYHATLGIAQLIRDSAKVSR